VSVSPLLLLRVKVCFESLPPFSTFTFALHVPVSSSKLQRTGFMTLCIQFFKVDWIPFPLLSRARFILTGWCWLLWFRSLYQLAISEVLCCITDKNTFSPISCLCRWRWNTWHFWEHSVRLLDHQYIHHHTTTVSRSIYTTRPAKQKMNSGLLSHSCFKPETAIKSYSMYNRELKSIKSNLYIAFLCGFCLT